MEKSEFPAEEGGLSIHTDLEGDNVKFEVRNKVWDPCPICEEEVNVNGRCKTCPNCGWSTCQI